MPAQFGALLTARAVGADLNRSDTNSGNRSDTNSSLRLCWAGSVCRPEDKGSPGDTHAGRRGFFDPAQKRPCPPPLPAALACRGTGRPAPGGYFLVCVFRSPRAFVTDTVTDRRPDKMALICVRSRPCRLANAVWLPSHSTAAFRSRITSSSSNITAWRPDTFSGMCFPSPYDMPLLA